MRLLVAWIKKKICRQLLHFFVEQTKQQNVDFNGIRTQIVRVEGKHADHLTTTWARLLLSAHYDWKLPIELNLLVFNNDIFCLII